MRRTLIASGLFVLSVLLGGCRAVGTIDVRSADEMQVDVTFSDTGQGQEFCTRDAWDRVPLELEPGEDADGATCRLYGTVHPEQLGQYVSLVESGEHLTLTINPLGAAPGSEPSMGTAYYEHIYSTIALTVTFPHRALSGTGEIDGNHVRFTDAKQFARAYGLRATALNHPGPERSVLGPLLGVAAGVIATLLWQAARRRRAASLRLAREQDAEHELAQDSRQADPHPPDLSEADHADDEGIGPSGDEQRTDDHPAEVSGRRDDPSRWAPGG